ncbi:MAG: hypothetical protein SWK76_01880 [Actinomycetota bacterium]|nr:hypothetical protein [Actinomycetota bacterium]
MRPLEPPQEIKRMAETGEVFVKTPEPQEMAYMVHKGSQINIQDSFMKLMKWISDNGFELMGPGEAVFHNDPIMVQSEDDLITEIRFPVRKK